VTPIDALRVRPAAVAGAFYPAGPVDLLDAIQRAFAGAVVPGADAPVPKALVVPHAGYPYSGPVAASAYLRLVPARASIRRVVLVGPSHRVPVRGVAVSSADAFATPLGLVRVDVAARDAALALPGVHVDDAAHAFEHSLEVQLPFLQVVLDRFELLPLAVNDGSAAEVSAVLEAVWGGSDTLIVASTDLSHFQPYADAVRLDTRTASAIVAASPEAIGHHDACGAAGLRGLLAAGRAHGLGVEQVDVRNSGDTAGDRQQVVGYGAFVIA